MKPSEYLENNFSKKDLIILKYGASILKIEELDNRFIDKEELKEKIQRIFNNNMLRDEAYFPYWEIDTIEEILKLLEE